MFTASELLENFNFILLAYNLRVLRKDCMLR